MAVPHHPPERHHEGHPPGRVAATVLISLTNTPVAIANSWERAAIGLVVSLLVLVLGWFSDRLTDAVPAFG